jgi:hypothetical protein
MVDLEQVLGAELMHPWRARDAVQAIRKIPVPAQERSFLFRRWSVIVEHVYTAEELAEVQRNGD